MSDKAKFLKKFFELGIATIPLYHRSKIPDTSLTGGTWEQFQTELPTEDQINSWFLTDWNNYAVICGWNNLVVIDFDNIDFFNIWQLHCNSMWINIADVAFKVCTHKGMHVYVCTETPASNDKRIAKKGGIDIQAQGKYVVGPGCIHPNGTQYEPIGEMIFPVVSSIKEILPLDLFPRVVCNDIKFEGTPVKFQSNPTECNYDPFDTASSGSNNVDFITRIKQAVRIEDLFSNVQRTSIDGRWLAALCPFHEDTHPSLWIDTRRQLCGCHVCGMKSMDVLNLYARMHNISESAAVHELARELGV